MNIDVNNLTEPMVKDIETRAAEMISKAKLQIITRRNLQFFGDTLKREFKADWSVPTAYTNGKTFGYNPAFIAQLTVPQIVFVLVHEVLHVKLGHHLRRGKRDPKRYNIAGDYVINLIAKQEGLHLLPDVLLDYKYAGLSTEQVYDKLPADQQQDPQPQPGQPGDGDGDEQPQGGNQAPEDGEQGQQQGKQQPGGGGSIVEVYDSPEIEGATEQEIEEEISKHDAQVRKDNAASKAAGTMPHAMKEYFDIHSGVPMKDWKTVLNEFASGKTRNEYDWNRFNRTHASRGIYLPDLGGNRIEQAAVAIDVSGSIDMKQLERFLIETNDIMANCNIQELTVMQCNTRITKVDEYYQEDRISPHVQAGGGTSFKPPFEYVDKYDLEPEFLIYFTDGYCSRYADEPDYPVLWVLYADNQHFDPPYGEVVRMDAAN